MKTYSLTPEEKSNLQFRKAVSEYLTDMVQQDVKLYVEFNVKKRLGLGKTDQVTEVDFDNGQIHVESDKDRIAVPSNEEVAAITKTRK